MDNDKPSRTAEYMALFRAVETAEPAGRRLFADTFAIPLLSGNLKALATLAQAPVVGRAVTRFLDAGWPRTRSSGVLRTRAIDELVCQSLQGGIPQFLLLGAGLDSRPYRLSGAERAKTFEVDHPATQNLKCGRLRAHLGKFPEHVRFVPVNFERDDLVQALLKAGFSPDESTIAVWEGVVSYLSPAAVHETFLTLARLLSPTSRLIFTYVHKTALDDSNPFPEARRWKSSVQTSGEPFVFGFEPADLGNYLRKRGFTLAGDLSTADLAKAYNPQFHRHEKGSALYRIATADREIKVQTCPR
jgi:methyltransferase (TIGR00027 family)